MDIYKVLKDFEEKHPSVKIQFEIGRLFSLGKIQITFHDDIHINYIIPDEVFGINNTYIAEKAIKQVLENMVRQAEDFEKNEQERGYRFM